MNERLVRFGFAGLIFITCTLMFTWLLGVDIMPFLRSFSDPNESKPFSISLIAGAISLALGTPAIGFILSTTLAYPFLRWWSHEGFYLGAIEFKNEYYSLLQTKFGDASGLQVADSGLEPKSKRANAVRVCHDVLFRSSVNEEALKYTARRLDIFWTHLNNIAAIFWALLFAILINFVLAGFGSLVIWKALIFAPFVFYCICGYHAGMRDLLDSMEFEKIYLTKFNRIKNEIEKKSK